MKNVYIYLAAILAVLVFSACSEDKDDSSKGGPGSSSKPGACYLTFNLIENYGDMCFEGITESLTRSDCNELIEEMEDEGIPSGYYSVKFQTSCPSGQDYKCYVDADEDEGYVYFYGSFFDKNSCNEFGGVLVTPSSSSAKSSSSNGSTKSSSSGNTTTSGACYATSTKGYNFASCAQPMSRAECMEYDEDGIDFSYVTSCPTGACDVDYDYYDGTTYAYYYYGDLCQDDFCDIYPEYCDDDDDWDFCDYYPEYCDGYGLKAKKLPKTKGLLKKVLR